MATKNTRPPIPGFVRSATKVDFDETTAADHEIVAATAGKRIRVIAWQLIIQQSNTLTFKSASTAISAPFAFNAPLIWEPIKGNPWIQPVQYITTSGEALNLTLANNNRVVGEIYYELVDPIG